MTTEHSTYTYEGGEQDTVTLRRGPLTPHGHAILKIDHSDGQTADCYVNTAWLRDRLDDLGEPRRTDPRPLTPDAITDAMVERYLNHRDPDEVRDWRLAGYRDDLVEKARAHLVAALTEPTRPEGAEEMADDMEDCLGDVKLEDVGLDGLADRLATLGYRKDANR